MEYSVSWPLGLLLTQEVLQQYQNVFQYVFRMRRVRSFSLTASLAIVSSPLCFPLGSARP